MLKVPLNPDQPTFSLAVNSEPNSLAAGDEPVGHAVFCVSVSFCH